MNWPSVPSLVRVIRVLAKALDDDPTCDETRWHRVQTGSQQGLGLNQEIDKVCFLSKNQYRTLSVSSFCILSVTTASSRNTSLTRTASMKIIHPSTAVIHWTQVELFSVPDTMPQVEWRWKKYSQAMLFRASVLGWRGKWAGEENDGY